MIITNLKRLKSRVIGATLLCLLVVTACNHPQSASTGTTERVSGVRPTSGPATIVYKTKADYYDKVPVTLNDDKTKIVSYPAPTDVYYNGQLSYPTKLSNGYLLDNRGINTNVAFLNITYEEYSKLTSVPSTDDLMSRVIDKAPLIEMYNMGSRYQYKDITNDLNKIIENSQLDKFKRIY